MAPVGEVEPSQPFERSRRDVQAMMTMIGVAASMTIGVAAVADRRRARRNNLDQVGFMPWQLITIMATFIALFAFAIALVSAS